MLNTFHSIPIEKIHAFIQKYTKAINLYLNRTDPGLHLCCFETIWPSNNYLFHNKRKHFSNA